MAKPKTKLPKLWIDFMLSRVSLTHFHGASRYAPVQPPKKCVWREDVAGVWFSPCHGTVLTSPETFCSRCGGKITRRSAR